jgi:alpha-glucosidase
MPPNKRWVQIRTVDQPDIHESIKRMRQVSDEFPERVMIGEAYLPIDRLMAYYGVDLTGFHLPFNFHLISTEWHPEAVASLIKAYEAALPPGGWPNWVLGNHDRSRVASRIGAAQARVAAMLLLTLRGTPTIYQGEEIGMVDVPIPPELVQDPLERNVPGFGLGRDPERTPMPWTSERYAGFSTREPWLPLNADSDTLNVLNQSRDTRSMFSLYRALIQLRRNDDVLSLGSFRLVAHTQSVLVYERSRGPRRVLVALNMSGEAQAVHVEIAGWEPLLSNYMDNASQAKGDVIRLRPDEGLILRMAPTGVES